MNLLDLARSAIAERVATNDTATPEQTAELRELIATVLANDTDLDRAEAFHAAMSDPRAALTSFRLLAAEVDNNRANAIASFRPGRSGAPT